MNWLDKLERKFGKYAIHNLMYYIIIFYVAGYALQMINPGFYSRYLMLDAEAILHGQIWRIFTFIMQPPSTSLLMAALLLYLYYMIGRQLEYTWGAFRFNVYFIGGVLFHVIVAIVIYLMTGMSLYIGTEFLNLSLFMMFAAIFPNSRFLLFFVIPVEGKWLAILDGVYFLWTIIQGFLPNYGGNGLVGYYYMSNAAAAGAALAYFILFYLVTKNGAAFSPKQMKRKKEFQKKIRPENHYANGAKHRCAVCGRTELDDPNLEFRYCSRCNGNYEYCQDHLFSHIHVK